MIRDKQKMVAKVKRNFSEKELNKHKVLNAKDGKEYTFAEVLNKLSKDKGIYNDLEGDDPKDKIYSDLIEWLTEYDEELITLEGIEELTDVFSNYLYMRIK